jgi:isoamylase
VLDDEDSAAGVPKGVVIDPPSTGRATAPPRIPWHRDGDLRGAREGAHDAPPGGAGGAARHLRGRRAPGDHRAPEVARRHRDRAAAGARDRRRLFLVEKGLRNYWGYNTHQLLRPAGRYAHARDYGEQVREFKEMVRSCTEAGIEVILDVVYNHTAEGNHLGPTLSFKGIDNPPTTGWSRTTALLHGLHGCGNSLNMMHPQTLKLVMDSLRYWVQEMHVDGFRFDLAATLARELHEVDRLSSFFDIIHQDPVISQVKLIAEPWDVGRGRLPGGQLPVLWAEWNGRTATRCAPTGAATRARWRARLPPHRLQRPVRVDDGRRPHASINFITAHDGFTLNDLVSYNDKHNEANGEDNRDGHDHNLSYNFGVEGPTDDPEIVRAAREAEAELPRDAAPLAGVPMICGGDEMGRTQHGQQQRLLPGQRDLLARLGADERDRELLEFTAPRGALRREHPVFRRRHFFQGRRIRGSELEDITWLRPDGEEMTEEEWNAASPAASACGSAATR